MLRAFWALLFLMPVSALAADVCIQVIQPAVNAEWVCKEFPTPCDVPSGWTATESCPVEKDLIVNGTNLGQCKSYYDGCNNCSVGANGQSVCTKRACIQQDTPKCLDEDTSLIDKEDQVSEPKFSVKNFNSCKDFNAALSDILAKTWRPMPYWRGYGVDDMAAMEWVATAVPAPTMSSDAKAVGGAAGNDVSTTNTRLGSVDESEIVKTDGNYAYYYDESAKAIRISKISPSDQMTLVTSIRIPETWYGVEMYLGQGRLTIVGTRSIAGRFNYYWYQGQSRSIVVVYGVKDPSKPVLERYTQIEGNLKTSRRVGNTLYVVTQNSVSAPYQLFEGATTLKSADIQTKLASSRVIPRIAEGRRLENGKFSTSVRAVADCSSLTAVLPDMSTLDAGTLSPMLTTLTAIDLTSPSAKSTNQVVFGDVDEVFMSEKRLYLASTVSLPASTTTSSADKKIVSPSARVAMIAPYPYYDRSWTLVHRFDVSGSTLKYRASGTTQGMPLNHYAMDEDSSGNFRIVTRSGWGEQNGTNVVIFSPEMKVSGKLENLAPGENFQAARFISDKLYLVTFEQIDPLFVVDVAKATAPKVIGEMKMPGYSTYLHPYDANHLIGIGYGTDDNGYGGWRNGGVQIALYKVDFTKKETPESLCGQLSGMKDRYDACLKIHDPERILVTMVGQKELGDFGSNSEVTNNPKLFVWNAARKSLLLPVTLYTSANDKNNPYRHSGVWQGIVGLSIDSTKGISELGRVTHLDVKNVAELRQKACEPYLKKEEKVCRKLLDGTEKCTDSSNPYGGYVPEYCYADATDSAYLADNLWNYSRDFIVRALYVNNILYSVGPSQIASWNMDKGFASVGVLRFPENKVSSDGKVMPMAR